MPRKNTTIKKELMFETRQKANTWPDYCHFKVTLQTRIEKGSVLCNESTIVSLKHH